MIKKTYVINGKKFASVPDYLEKNGLMCPVTSDNFTIQIVETEIDDLEIKQAAADEHNRKRDKASGERVRLLFFFHRKDYRRERRRSLATGVLCAEIGLFA